MLSLSEYHHADDVAAHELAAWILGGIVHVQPDVAIVIGMIIDFVDFAGSDFRGDFLAFFVSHFSLRRRQEKFVADHA